VPRDAGGHEGPIARLESGPAERDERTAGLQAGLVERDERIASLQAELAERDRLIAELNAFAHTMAHNLKSPLACVLGYAGYLAGCASSLAPQETLEYVDHIARSGQKMAAIIDATLLLASAWHGDVPREPLAMGDIVAAALERLEDDIRTVEAEIVSPDTWPVASGYAPWVEEVWVNYLSNAIKYGGRPSAEPPVRPRVEIGAVAADASSACFWVRDNGWGIAPEDQDRLFVPFSRLDRSSEDPNGGGPVQPLPSGHGLGLSIVQRIIARLGGRVGVSSVPGQGSTFSFTLPSR
jgi:signal transduction histidine kinase